MRDMTFFQRIRLNLYYILPALVACLIIVKLYHERLEDIGNIIKITCQVEENDQCVSQNMIAVDKQEKALGENKQNTAIKICDYRQIYANQQGFHLLSIPGCSDNTEHAADFKAAEGNQTKSSITAYINSLSRDVDMKLNKIFLYNLFAVLIMVLLPYLLMGNLLASSKRVLLDYYHRTRAAFSNVLLKFILALIMSIGWIYILNPMGRGASTYYQFFIAAGINDQESIPIYIQAKVMVPVLAGFFGWYLHLTGYVFTKLIHHDVISGRVYNLLFKKFIVVYGVALVLPASGLIDDQNNASFLMFLIGLFPLSAMSMLIESASKMASSNQQSKGNLSVLPGISRWHILRLEEEGVDSMASLASINPKTVTENLQFIQRLVFFWRDIAQLYTIVSHESYEKIKEHCQTASEFIRLSKEQEFVDRINQVEGVGSAEEISRNINRTFDTNEQLIK